MIWPLCCAINGRLRSIAHHLGVQSIEIVAGHLTAQDCVGGGLAVHVIFDVFGL